MRAGVKRKKIESVTTQLTNALIGVNKAFMTLVELPDAEDYKVQMGRICDAKVILQRIIDYGFDNIKSSAGSTDKDKIKSALEELNDQFVGAGQVKNLFDSLNQDAL